jgi:3-dehydroquinate synthase
MRKERFRFSNKEVEYIFNGSFSQIEEWYPKDKVVVITDQNVFEHHSTKFEEYATIKLKAGEEHKQQKTVDSIIDQLLQLQADKQTVIIGVGGGVITDMAGYAASIYKRGVKLVLVPTSVLAMVDAAVGGKNGVDVGPYKNMVGTVYQPDHLLFDYQFLDTLPEAEWVNGFAEIIKHACIKDAKLFDFLFATTISDFRNDKMLLASLIEKNVAIKTAVVLSDEFETGDRKLLNFGHTIGHAIENTYHLAHGHAVSIGMVAACSISEEINNFYSVEKQRVIQLLQQYQLTVKLQLDKEKIWGILLMDKKRSSDTMSFILLDSIGAASIKPIPLAQLKDLIDQCL